MRCRRCRSMTASCKATLTPHRCPAALAAAIVPRDQRVSRAASPGPRTGGGCVRIGGLAVGAALLAMLVAGCSGGKAAPAVSTMVAPSAGASVPLGAATARPTATTPPPAASASASSPVGAAATLPAGVQPVDYTSAANWLCRPGKADTPCTEDLDSAAVGSDGSKVQPFVAAAKPPIDCFYVYPTASSDPGDNSDLVTGRAKSVPRSTRPRALPLCAGCSRRS